MPVPLPSHNGGVFLEFKAMALSHEPDLNLESIGQEPPPCLLATGPSAELQVKDVPFLVLNLVIPLFHQPGLESFLPVRLPYRPEKSGC